MPTDLPQQPARRQPWPGQRLAFVLVAVPALPVIALASSIVALLTWLCPDPDPPD